ncbi:hypothetical protein [Pleomorphomonas sp. JP5]|uniref:hypothetical protein n=1 Tax=Pleomorphomonas sp. JP5 TaxID=2942998 RepID=UPI002043628A|nr:hypothetical protein [Pleomorphomonas sp. JP5]MCM5557442.1 hypothetical protein [Pleomorphomonas sp. JP5]
MNKLLNVAKIVAKSASRSLALCTVIAYSHTGSMLRALPNLRKPLNWMKKTAEVLTCHHALYAAMAALNAGLVLHALDKSTYTLMVLYIYFVLAVRP